jgi:hypothetical protein
MDREPGGVGLMFMAERIQGASSDGIETHTTSYFRKIWWQLSPVLRNGIIIDPFARNCSLAGEWTNDLDLDTKARHHVDALEFIKKAPRNHFDLAILDPPFSSSQAERKYGAKNIYADGSYFSKVAKALVDDLKSGGYLLKFGYNTTRHDPRLVLIQYWVVNFGGNRNDVLVSLWRKSQTTLDEFGA